MVRLVTTHSRKNKQENNKLERKSKGQGRTIHKREQKNTNKEK